MISSAIPTAKTAAADAQSDRACLAVKKGTVRLYRSFYFAKIAKKPIDKHKKTCYNSSNSENLRHTGKGAETFYGNL